MKLNEIKDLSAKTIEVSSKDKVAYVKLAKNLGVDVTELEKFNDEELETILHNIGFHDEEPDSDFDPKELAAGLKVEKEHSNSLLVAKLIVKDHLKELPDYYSRLDKMEKEGGKQND